MEDSGELLLEVTQLHKYFGERKVLDGIQLQVEKGEVIVILGPSGCGKSTFLRCLNGLEPVQEGRYNIAGRTLRGLL